MVNESIDHPNFWEECYQDGTTNWDLGQPTPPFVSFLESGKTPLPGKTAVLGCGRGHDAFLFAKHGFDVTGFDFAPSAILEAERLHGEANRTAQTLKLQFLQRDIFELSAEFPATFDYVVEHTCFCAIPPEKRPDYVQVVQSILKPHGQILGIFFTHSRPGGPPFGVTPAEIRHYFEPNFEILDLSPIHNSIPRRQGEEHWGQLKKSK